MIRQNVPVKPAELPPDCGEVSLRCPRLLTWQAAPKRSTSREILHEVEEPES